jgi:hypothetical protein
MDFNSLELRKVENGFIVTINVEGNDGTEYVFPNLKKTITFIKSVADTDEVEAKKLLEHVIARK